jgi:hypothetical protein
LVHHLHHLDIKVEEPILVTHLSQHAVVEAEIPAWTAHNQTGVLTARVSIHMLNISSAILLSHFSTN